MREMNEQQIRELATAQDASPYALFFYTPLCGTCKVAERMLAILLEMRPELPVIKINVNSAPQLCQDWRIESVPCLALVKPGEPSESMQKIYAFSSIEHVYERLQTLFGPK